MRKLWFVLFVLMVSAPVFAAVEVKDGKVTANVQSELLRDVISQIGEQAGLQVSIDNSIANDMVYANFHDLPVGQAVRKLLEGIDVNYAVIAGADGNPTAIYVSKSESPGAPPKKLDSRPVAASPNRGVVTPVMPQVQQQIMPPTPQNSMRNPPNLPNKESKDAAGDQKPNSPTGGGSIPTAGSFSGAPPPGAQPTRPPDNKALIQNNGAADSDDDDDDDDE